MAEVLSVHQEDAVRHLVLNRPAKRNALSAELRRRIVVELDDAASDDTVGAAMISGAGAHFCAGFDLAELAESPDPARVFAEAGPYHDAVVGFPKPLVAAVAGSAVAGGMDLALMCDLRVAASDAVFGQPQVLQGVPAMEDLIVAVVGDAVARDLCFTGRMVDGTEALRLGLVQRLVEGDPRRPASALAAQVAALPDPVAAKRSFLGRHGGSAP